MIKLKNGYQVEFGTYYYNKKAIAIQVYKNGEPYWTATTYIEEYPYLFGEVTIKNYSENEGIEKVIEELLGPQIGWVTSGFVEVPVYQLKEEYIKIAKEVISGE